MDDLSALEIWDRFQMLSDLDDDVDYEELQQCTLIKWLTFTSIVKLVCHSTVKHKMLQQGESLEVGDFLNFKVETKWFWQLPPPSSYLISSMLLRVPLLMWSR